MISINMAAPSGLTASSLHQAHSLNRAPRHAVRVVCGPNAGLATAYPASGLELEKEKLEMAHVAERVPARVPTLGERMRYGGLIKDRIAYKECFVVRSYEVGPNKAATIETMLNLIQETMCNHAQSWGWSRAGEFPTLPSMRKYNLTWLNYQMHVEMNKYPGWGDVVEIEHWCEPEGRNAARFDYIMKNLYTGELIGRATSKWLMIDQYMRKPQKMNDEVRDEYLAVCSKFSRLAFPEGHNVGLKKIPKLDEAPQYSLLNLVPRRSDLNMNNQVNSVAYFSLLLESMPQDIIDTHELQSITIDYRREFRFYEFVDSFTSEEFKGEALDGFSNNCTSFVCTPNLGRRRRFLHSLKMSGTGEETNRGRTTWRKQEI